MSEKQKRTDLSSFGPAAEFKLIPEALDFLGDLAGMEAKQSTAAYIMYLAACQPKGGEYRSHALEVLDYLAKTKAEIDCAMAHQPDIFQVTGGILRSAQEFADQGSPGPTEWVTSQEIVDHVLQSACEISRPGKWERLVRNEKGVVIGLEPI